MKIVKKEVDYYQCDYCNHTDMSEMWMRRHEMTHRQENCKHENCHYWINDEVIKSQCDNCGIVINVNMEGHEEKIFKMLMEK